MPYSERLNFVRELLKNMNISSYIAEEPGQGISSGIDMGLRSLLFGTEDYSSLLRNSMADARSNTIYRFVDEYWCNYIFMRLPEKGRERYFFIGPYLLHIPDDGMLRKKFGELVGEAESLGQLRQYYAMLPIIEEENLLLTVASTLGRTLWGTDENFVTEYVDYTIPDGSEPIEVVPYKRDGSPQSAFSLSMLESNYANEKILMDAVSRGKLHKVSAIASTVFNNGTEPRINDSLRNRKNYLIILNTLLRKAAEYGGVHPFHLHNASSHYAGKIENLTSIKESLHLQEEMIRNYCLLVKHHSLSKYSYIVGKAITIIGYDLLADLSLSSIAEQLNVSPSYLSGLFRKECGCTLTDYVNKKRIEHAVSLLFNSEKQIQTVAYECGFQDPNYFVRLFKKHTGVTPNQYRKNAQISSHKL